jgi:hypothetical protein
VNAAGLDYQKATLRPRNPYQTKEAVVAAIKARKRKGWSLSSSDLRRGKHRDQSLLEAALKRFGKWSVAKRAAGRK